MYRLLIVDDEPIIVEGLSELILQSEYPLEVYQAFDGMEAIAIARKLRIDILLTDIEMPEMNGIELQKEVLRLWPRCKSIFLTGYNEFDYIQSSIRGGAIDYVLKTEGDDPILSSVEKAIRVIAEEVTYEGLIESARSSLKLALPALRKEYLNGLLEGEASSLAVRKERFAQFEVPLDPDLPVVMAVGRIDRWREDATGGDKVLFAYSINNIFDEFFAHEFELTYFRGDHERLIWLLQPKAESGYRQAIAANPEPYAGSSADSDPEAALHAYLLGMLESVQTACSHYLKLTCSFVVSSEPFEWDSLASKYERLSQLFGRGLGLGSQMLLSDDRAKSSGDEEARSKVKRIRLLDQYLMQKERAKFEQLFDGISEAVGEAATLETGLPLEVFYELAAIFIPHLNRFEALDGQAVSGKLFSIREHRSWKEASDFFRELADLLFDRMDGGNEQETNEVVEQIHRYVEKNIEGDLTLNRLAEHVYLTPFYLSRLYKQKTGHNISDYTARTRIDKAKRLLGESTLKIHEVGMRIGYDSASYFTRFFKKATLLTPQEYRDSLK
ncbi:response regulator [Paenibacillus sp. CF384]|uniref:response regulator transcription factor n=1 Tax=Paenibacillus sp. CF384 TaxID=1884382 RepID=UPI00089CBFA5|nr:response regulator [Paenibacillus sp. CF384]SDW04973.1 two-component system, response regulator YesN [Paenibacillus sp. CF384]